MTAPRRLRAVDSNAWRGAEDDYDPNAFYVRSCDNKVRGDSTYSKIRFPSEVVAAVSRLISTGQLAGTPIDSWAAFVRDAVVHRMYEVSRMVDDEMFTEEARRQRHLAEAEGWKRESETLSAIVTEAEEGFANARKSGDYEYARRLLSTFERVVDTMREPYQTQLETHMRAAREWVKGSAR